MKADSWGMLGVVIFFAVMLALEGCKQRPSGPPSYVGMPQKLDAGVTFVGQRHGDWGYVHNNNSYGVTIRGVAQSQSHGLGESTRWVKQVPPETRYEFAQDDSVLAVYIYRTGSGELLGFISEEDQ